MIVPNLVIIASGLAIVGTAMLPRQLVRLVLEVVLAYLVYRGAGWARYLAVILFGLGAIVSFVSLKTWLMVLGSVQVLAIVLLTSKDARRFFDTQYERSK